MPTVTGYNTNNVLSVFRNKEVWLLNKFEVVAGKDEDPNNLWIGFQDNTSGNGKFIYKGVEQVAKKTFWIPLSDTSELKFVGAASNGAMDTIWVRPWAWNTKTNTGSYGNSLQFYAQTYDANVGSYAKITDIKFDKTTGDWQKQPFMKLYKDMKFVDINDLGKIILGSAKLVEASNPHISFTTSGEWNGSKPTYVYAHGFNDGPSGIRTDVIRNALTQKYGSDSNIVIVNWESLARDTSGGYPMPFLEASVTKQVGESIAAALVRSGADISKTSLIGHSLGSFVMAAAAEQLKAMTGQKVKELVALDTAFGNYDIDARVPGTQRELPFTKELAVTTKSDTISDLDANISIAGDTSRAATADYAYLVQYTKSGAYLWDAPQASTLAHVGINGIYADLILKDMVDHNSSYQLNMVNKFDAKGVPSSTGLFDGVIVATQPWVNNPQQTWQTMTMTLQQKQGSGIPEEHWFKMPKAIGWTDGYQNPFIYGSQKDDVMFYDRFDSKSVTSSGGVVLVAGRGNDILIGDQLDDNKGVDQFWGGEGSDTFVFGYKRYGNIEFPYDDRWSTDVFGKGLDAYAVIKDFDLKQDQLEFIWSISSIGYKDGEYIDRGLVNTWGKGVGIIANDDLIGIFQELAPRKREHSCGIRIKRRI